MHDSDEARAPSPAAALASAYLTALQAKDRDAILALMTEDFALEVPINASGTNDQSDSWYGLGAAAAGYDATFRTIDILKYVDIEITEGRDPNVAFLEGRGDMIMFNGNPYRNQYIFRFDVIDGKIQRIREYANPVTAAISWGTIGLPAIPPM